jgi:hypothetical protein
MLDARSGFEVFGGLTKERNERKGFKSEYYFWGDTFLLLVRRIAGKLGEDSLFDLIQRIAVTD